MSWRRSGWSLGSHTATHPNLRAVDSMTSTARSPSRSSRSSADLGTCDTFAYPFGFTTPDVSRFVEGSDLATIMVVGGSNATPNPLRIARTSLTATTPAAMFSELEIVDPARARIRAHRRDDSTPCVTAEAFRHEPNPARRGQCAAMTSAGA